MIETRRVCSGHAAAAILLLTIMTRPGIAQTSQGCDTATAPSAQASTAQRADVSLAAVIRDFARDVHRLPSKETGMWLGAGLAAALAGHEEDRHLTSELTGAEHLTRTFQPGTLLGDGWIQGGGAVATYAIGRLTGRSSVAQLGSELMRAQVINGAMTLGVKVSVRRTRPSGGRFSFPSGHVSATVASATVLAEHFGWKVAIPAYAVAGYVATSRIQTNDHFLSDVILGTAVGLASARTITIGRGTRQHAVVIAPTAGGVVISLTGVPAR